MNQGPAASIQQLYIRYFGRPADYQGLDFWTNALSNGVSISSIESGFESSPEFLSLYSGRSASEIVIRAYDYLFGRYPDSAGLAFWSGHLQFGRLTLNNILDVITASAVAEDLLTLQSRTETALSFTEALRINTISFTSSFDHETGRTWLNQVSSSVASRNLAILQIPNLIGRMNGREPGIIDEEIATAFQSMLRGLGSQPTLKVYYDRAGLGQTRLTTNTVSLEINDEILGKLRLAFSAVDSLAPAFQLTETTNINDADIEVHVVQGLNNNASGISTTSIITNPLTRQQIVYSRIDLLRASGTDAQYLVSHEVLHAFGGEHPFDSSDGDFLPGVSTADTLLAYDQSTQALQTGYNSIFSPLDKAMLRYLYG